MLAAISVVAAYLCWQMVSPFVSPLTWAAALAIASQPLRKRLVMHMPRVAAALLTMAILLIGFGIPAFLVSHELLQESVRAQQTVVRIRELHLWQIAPAGGMAKQALAWVMREVDVAALAGQQASWLAGFVAPALTGSVWAISQIATAIFILFFFLRDQELVLKSLRRMLPLGTSQTQHLLGAITSAIYAAVYGRLGIGLLQGFCGGLIFWFVGLPAPAFWGSVMAILSVLPVIGAFVVWVPAALYLLATGAWGEAIGLTLWGIIVIHPIDNLLYPILVGEKLGLHPLVLFFAFVGGLLAFGAPGLILGPAMIAGSFSLIAIWREESPSERDSERVLLT